VTRLDLLRRSGIGKDVVKQPYRSGEDYTSQLRTPTEREAALKIIKKESEFVKPYLNDSYEEMEYGFIPPPDFTQFNPLTFPDFPWATPQLPDGYYTVDSGGYYKFFCPCDPCWCPGQTLYFDSKCTYRVVGVSYPHPRWIPDGFSVGIKGQTLVVVAPSDAKDSDHVTIDINMRTPSVTRENEFVYGSHYDIEVYKCSPSSRCCDCGVTIGYTTQTMQVDEAQDLIITGGGSVSCYSWEVTSGVGELSDAIGLTTTYTAPSTNAECDNPTISLSCNGEVIDTLKIAVNANTSTTTAYKTIGSCISDKEGCLGGCSKDKYPSHTDARCVVQNWYRCDGVLKTSVEVYGYRAGTQTYWNFCTPVSAAGFTNTIPTCDGLLAVPLSGHSGYNSIDDVRTAAMITAGCCPGDLL